MRTPKLELAAEPSTGKCWIPPKKNTPHLRAKKKPQQDGRRDTIVFKIKFQTCQRRSEEANKILCVPGLRERNSDPHKRLSQTHISIRHISKKKKKITFTSLRNKDLCVCVWLLSLITLTKHFIFLVIGTLLFLWRKLIFPHPT